MLATPNPSLPDPAWLFGSKAALPSVSLPLSVAPDQLSSGPGPQPLGSVGNPLAFPAGSGVLAQEDDLAMSLQFMDVSSSPHSSLESKLEGLKSSFVENPQYFCNTRRCSGLGGGPRLHCWGGRGAPILWPLLVPSWALSPGGGQPRCSRPGETLPH